MAVQIDTVQGYPLRAPSQFLQPPPLPVSSMVPVMSFGPPPQMMSMPVASEAPASGMPTFKPLPQPLTSASPSRTTGASVPAPGVIPGVPGGSYDGRRMRSKSTQRRTVDYNASLVNYLQVEFCFIYFRGRMTRKFMTKSVCCFVPI